MTAVAGFVSEYWSVCAAGAALLSWIMAQIIGYVRLRDRDCAQETRLAAVEEHQRTCQDGFRQDIMSTQMEVQLLSREVSGLRSTNTKGFEAVNKRIDDLNTHMNTAITLIKNGGKS